MATSYVAQDQINRALRLLGVLAEGEVPSASTSQDALTGLNQMLDSWNTERLSIFAMQEQVVNWPVGTVTQTLGPTGTLGAMIRPVRLDDSTYFRDVATQVSFPIKIINQEQYNDIPLKTATSSYPEVLYSNPTEPNATLYVYPVPTTLCVFHFMSVLELSQPATLTTTLVFPDGYLRAFAYNLACELAPEFGTEPSPTVMRIAMMSKRDIKRINDPQDVMSMPNSLVVNNSRFNIYTGL